ncbi:CG4213 [Drosophila busckii]|uniref:CG4213 n=1 Tax=Drosophila busckii TaxID=30019 RepID=A0A0M3QT93_DROBS|nr:trichohyalin [Drosophila busckii]ALC38513.1 CG4213 [Drosophila busckii]
MGNAESTAQQLAHESPTDEGVNVGVAAAVDDEPWWQQIEHENLILEPVKVEQPARVDMEQQSREEEEEQQQEQRPSQQEQQTLNEFKEQLASKRLARQEAVQDLREELAKLREELTQERAENQRLRAATTATTELVAIDEQLQPDADDENPSSRSRHANIELANAQLSLQLANADNLTLRGEVAAVQRQVGTLKEVISCCKQMLSVKEEQCAQLKMKLQEIENSFSEREMKIMSNNLRQEYERQLVNIRQLRQLYEERQRVAAAEYENLQRLISIKRDELTAEQEKTKSLEERNQTLLQELETANAELAKLREECGELKYEKRTLKEQVGAVNMLFSQLVLGFNVNNNLNIDRLTQMLEENRDLLNEMTQAEGSCSDGATLPKLLFELVEQASSSADQQQLEPSVDSTDSAVALKSHEPEIMGKVAMAQEIIGNLPKVWKVLMELLSHHKIERVQFEEPTTQTSDSSNTQTATATAATTAAATTAGKAAELSVSKTYIKLKDLILEKKSLVKETNRLKTLNCHLDYRLNEQEKRLSAVSLELTKTWHLVGKMQRQHRQLHTQEQILRYQLQQKRRLLCELKDELDYCRRKWALARAKNDESQELCNDWRREFARRKLEDAHQSAESGYSDSGPQSDEDAAVANGVPEVESHGRRKHLRDQFEHTRKIKRMQSSSPGRAAVEAAAADEAEVIVLRWNSAPPTCGWREEEQQVEEVEQQLEEETGAAAAVPHSSRSRQRASEELATGTASRIQKLEQQCKSLIQQVLETSGNRERLEIQLCRFQDEVAPVQHAVPLDEFINRKRLERMTRASSAPATGSLTPREEEYTRKRSERLGRLEEESRQLLSRIKRTTDRGHYLKKSLDRIRRAPSREGSAESNTEEEQKQSVEQAASSSSPLTAQEEAYTAQRAARLQRLEQEGQQLLQQLGSQSERAAGLANKLDVLHEQQLARVPQTVEQRLENIERSSEQRGERLRRLEAEGNALIARLSHTSERGTAMINRIAEREANRRIETETATATAMETATEMAASTSVVAAQLQLAAAVGTAAILPHATGAIPKQSVSQPKAQLCAAVRHEDASKKRTTNKQTTATTSTEQTEQPAAEAPTATATAAITAEPESLELMVQRLRELPYPAPAEDTAEHPAEPSSSSS